MSEPAVSLENMSVTDAVNASLDIIEASASPDTEAAPAPASAEPEAPAEAPPAPAAAAEPEDPFSPAALATAEGITKAQQLLKAERSRWLDARTRVDHREKKFNETLNRFKQEKTEFFAVRDQIRADVQAMRTGDPKTKLDALGRLFGKGGADAYEELSHAFLGGKPAQLPPGVADLVKELKDEIAALKGELTSGKAQAQHGEAAQFMRQEQAKILGLAKDSSRFPYTAVWAAENPEEIADEVVDVVVKHHQNTGERLTYEKVLAKREEILRSRYERATGPKGQVDPVPTQKPVVGAQRSPGETLSTQGTGNSRLLTEEERLADLAKDSDFLRQIGLPI